MYESLLNSLREITENKRVCISIDGNCGSGKTQLANFLATQLHCNLIHIDYYYLPFSMRKENWREIPGGNMNFERLKTEVLEPFKHCEPIHSTRFNQFEQKLAETTTLKDNPVLILEGSYSSHPEIIKYSDYHIFLTCNPEVQIARLKAREGDNFSGFATTWIQKENDYFNAFHIQEQADIVIDTTALF